MGGNSTLIQNWYNDLLNIRAQIGFVGEVPTNSLKAGWDYLLSLHQIVLT
jgi:hypothetical protein